MRAKNTRIKITDPDLNVTVSLKFTVDAVSQVGGIIDISIVGIPDLANPLEANSSVMNPAIYQLRDAILSTIGAVKVTIPLSTSQRAARA